MSHSAECFIWRLTVYGFSRVLETFALTDKPIRFKPMDIYYHMSKRPETDTANNYRQLHVVACDS